MADSDSNWRRWGERDPYFAVLTDARYRSASIASHRDEFFASGVEFVRHWLYQLEHHFGAIPRGRALDFGCGVGRLTIPLSDHFAQTTGLDISPAMLQEAAANSAGRAIDYCLSDDALSAAPGPFDFVISCIVLQHIPVARGMALLERLLSRVDAGGGCLIQLSTRQPRRRGRKAIYFLRHSVPGGQGLLNILEGRSADTPVMQMNEYSLDAVLPLFRRLGFARTVVSFEDHGLVETATILARRD